MELLCAITVSMASFFAVIEREHVNPGIVTSGMKKKWKDGGETRRWKEERVRSGK